MTPRIEDYALLGDLHTAALVSRTGSIDWLCLPRFDSAACFAALLGTEQSGFWRLAPAAGLACTRRRYRGDSLVLDTEWDTPDGTVRLIDFMPPRGQAADVVRIVEGVSGRVPMRMALRLRFDYGHLVPWVRRVGDALEAVAGPDAVWLRTPVALRGENLTTYADFTVAAGQRIPFVLTHHASHLPKPRPAHPEQALVDTLSYWSTWIRRCEDRGEWAPAVRRSLLTLKALTYAPTGGIVAAATTSLPEEIGGLRNWDYRYCWLRDATFTLQALVGTGYVEEAKAWREWLLRAVAGDPADLQIMYSIDGARRLPEYELDWLPGYEGSAPVRVGNAASAQLQLDVWGEVLDVLNLGRAAGLAADADAWDVQRALLDHLEGAWREPDNGLWEVRGERRHFVHSKVLAWVGFDRAIDTVRSCEVTGPVDRWLAARDAVHREVCERGFDADRNTFTQSYGSREVDAALLLLPQLGFLPWEDPRVTGTVDAVVADLSVNGLLRRYRVGSAAKADDVDASSSSTRDPSPDGLPGAEGAFLACSFWLVVALDGIGRHRQARVLFERLLALRNDVGLLSEEYDPSTGRQLGNTPQAFSHVGLVNAAHHLGRGGRT